MNSTARNIHLVRTAQVAGEAFGYQPPHEGAGASPPGWARRGLALLLLGFVATAAYLAL